MNKAALTFLLLLLPASAHAQSDQSIRQPVGLFQDMQADTVTSDLFNHFADTPGIAFHVTRPVPGRDLVGEVTSMVALDFDNDGDQDCVLGSQGLEGEPGARLLLGNGDGTFTEAGVPGLPRRLYRMIAADLDNDGWTDLLATRLEGGAPRLARWISAEANAERARRYEPLRTRVVALYNEQGQSWRPAPVEFPEQEIRDAHGLIHDLLNFAACDLDQDSWLDFVFCWEDVNPTRSRQVVLRGGPDGPRVDPAALEGGPQFGFIPTLLDVDGDGDQDLILQGGGYFDQGPGLLTWWSNEQGRLVFQGDFRLPQKPRITSLQAVDVNNDRRLDLLAGSSDFQGGANELFVAQADGSYLEQGQAMGLWAGYNYTRSLVPGDWNQDTWTDLLQVRMFSEGGYTESALFLNDEGRRFLNITGQADAPLGPSSMAALALDADADGDLDILLGHLTSFLEVMPLSETGAKLLRNDCRTGNWLEVRLEGTRSHRSALGSQVVLHLPGTELLQPVPHGVNWSHCQQPLPAHFGLGRAARADSISVRWPDGAWEVFPGAEANRQIVLLEGQGRSRP
jgi:hypothetical protein